MEKRSAHPSPAETAQKDKRLRVLYLRELMDCSGEPQKPLGLMYSHVIFQLAALRGGSSEISPGFSPAWAHRKMGSATLRALADESQRIVRRYYDRSLCWGSCFRENSKWADTVYTQAFTEEETAAWAEALYKTIIIKCTRILMTDPEMAEENPQAHAQLRQALEKTGRKETAGSKHLSDEQAYALVRRISDGLDLSAAEAEALTHAAECGECFPLLSCMMAMHQAARHIGSGAAVTLLPVREAVTAVLRLAVDRSGAVLDQVEYGEFNWSFRKAPMAPGLTDRDNARTFVACEVDGKRLVIQIDSAAPRAFLKPAGGRQREIPLEQRGGVYRGEVHGLEEGNYEIILEK